MNIMERMNLRIQQMGQFVGNLCFLICKDAIHVIPFDDLTFGWEQRWIGSLTGDD